MNEIEKYLSENTAIYTNTFQQKESRWFNGRSYYPSYKYKVSTERFRLVYDYLSNEFSYSSALIPSKTDFHIVRIRYELPLEFAANFKITSQSFLWKWFNKKKFKVKTTDETLEKYLQKNELLNQLYTTYFDPEFSPIIRGENKTENYVVSFRFSLIRFNPEIFELISKFLYSFEQEFSAENLSKIS